MNVLGHSFFLISIVCFSGFLSMSEVALVSARKSRLKQMADDGVSGAKVALTLADSHANLLASLQVYATVLGISAGAFGSAALADELSAWLSSMVPSMITWSTWISVAIIVAAQTFLVILFGIFVPKRIALFFPEKISVVVAPAISNFGKLVSPVVNLLSLTTDGFIGAMRLSSLKIRKPKTTEDEIITMVKQGAEDGVFDRAEETMLRRVLEFGDLTGAHLMTPRTRMVIFDTAEPIDSALDRMLSTGFSSFPLYSGQLENIVGVVSVKQAFVALRNKTGTILADIMITPVFLPDSAKATKIFDAMRAARHDSVILIDEFGGVAGLITVTDLMEAVVGEMPGGDRESSPRFVQRSDGSWLIDGSVNLFELEETLGFVAGEEVSKDYQSVGGLLMHHLSSVPKEGQFIEIQNWRFEVIDMDHNRIDKVLATVIF